MHVNNKVIVGLLIAAVLIVIAAVAYVVMMLPGVQQTSTTGKAEKGPITIVYTDNGFQSPTYKVAKGEVVTVTNKSTGDLQFSSGNHPTHLEEPELNMNVLAPGESAKFTPTKIGTWIFHDHLHSERTGTLRVTE